MAEIEYAAKLREKTKGCMFDLSNIKIQLDGTMPGTPSAAYLKEPYTDARSQEHQHRGQLRFDIETLTAAFKKSHELGFTVDIHAMGDGKLTMTLDAIEKAPSQTRVHDYRDAVTHLQLVDKADISRMAKLNVIASTDPHWFDMDPEYFNMMVAVLGKERAENQLPMKSFFDAGVVVTYASNHPVTNPDYPLIGICKSRTARGGLFEDVKTVLLGYMFLYKLQEKQRLKSTYHKIAYLAYLLCVYSKSACISAVRTT